MLGKTSRAPADSSRDWNEYEGAQADSSQGRRNLPLDTKSLAPSWAIALADGTLLPLSHNDKATTRNKPQSGLFQTIVNINDT